LALLGTFIAPVFFEVGAFLMLVSLVVLLAIHFGVLSRPPGTPRENE